MGIFSVLVGLTIPLVVALTMFANLRREMQRNRELRAALYDSGNAIQNLTAALHNQGDANARLLEAMQRKHDSEMENAEARVLNAELRAQVRMG
jgi:protein-disulfide isomerase-like protein with CxxC motif